LGSAHNGKRRCAHGDGHTVSVTELTRSPSADKKDKQKIGAQRVAGVVICTSLVAVLTISNLDAVAKSWYGEGSLLPAISCLEMFTSIQTVLGVESARLANAWAELGHCYSKVPRYKDAVRTAQHAIDMKRRLVGENHPSVLILKSYLADYLYKGKRYAESDKLLAETLKQAEALSPPDELSKGYILDSTVKSFIAQKRWDEAIAAAKQLELIDDRFLVDSRSGFNARELLAQIYALKGQTAEATTLAKDSLALKNTHLASNNVELALGHEVFGKVLICSGQKDAASGEFKQAMSLLEKEYGNSSERVQYWWARYQHLLNQKTSPFEEEQ